MLIVETGVCSETGPVRPENQDAYGVFSQSSEEGRDHWLVVVADGMGGHVRGRDASRMAVEKVRATFYQHPAKTINERLRQAFEAANDHVYREAQVDHVRLKMGTTCTALVLTEDRVYGAHVGDSRAYLIDRQGIRQISRDHTFVESMQQYGILTAEQAREHPRRNELVRVIGGKDTVEVDILDPVEVAGEQWFLLCSDGLSLIDDQELRDIVLVWPPQQASEHLVHLANERGGLDNSTALVVALR